jgi:putative tryptophan/tyrosine transport system substrate-binding protein
MLDLRRRQFIRLLGGAAAAWPLAARAQQPAMPVIGFLSSGTQESDAFRLPAIRRGLNEVGYVVGRNVAIEYRWAENQHERLPELAMELVHRPVTVILALGGPAALTARVSTATIPILFQVGIDPVTSGLVASINRPNGNATGVSLVSRELNAKKLELLHELLPTATGIGVLLNPSNPSIETFTSEVMEAASSLKQRIIVLKIGTDYDLDATLANLVEQRVYGLVVTDDPFFTNRRDRIAALAARHRIPAIYPWREYVEAGGLVSYGPSLTDAFRQSGIYVGRVLRGEKPAELPVIMPSKFELVINLKAARGLGLEIPPTLLARADEVIE